MDPIQGATLEFPSPEQIMNFTVKIKPNEGLYAGATFVFQVEIPNSYP